MGVAVDLSEFVEMFGRQDTGAVGVGEGREAFEPPVQDDGVAEGSGVGVGSGGDVGGGDPDVAGGQRGGVGRGEQVPAEDGVESAAESLDFGGPVDQFGHVEPGEWGVEHAADGLVQIDEIGMDPRFG